MQRRVYARTWYTYEHKQSILSPGPAYGFLVSQIAFFCLPSGACWSAAGSCLSLIIFFQCWEHSLNSPIVSGDILTPIIFLSLSPSLTLSLLLRYLQLISSLPFPFFQSAPKFQNSNLLVLPKDSKLDRVWLVFLLICNETVRSFNIRADIFWAYRTVLSLCVSPM